MQSSAPAERSQAVLAIGHQRETRAIDQLVAILCTDDDLNVQEDTTWSLVRMGSDAVDALLPAIEHDDPKARHNVVHTLGKIADVRALDTLIQATSDADQKVRYKAIYALGQIGHVDALEALIAALDDDVQEVSWMARETLVGYGDKATMHLIAALDSASAVVQELLISLLGDTRDERAVEPLIALLAAPDWQIRFAAIQALGELGDARALPGLRALVDDDDARIRAIAKAMSAQLNGVS